MKTASNNVMVKLDEENNYVITPSGIKLYVDNTYEPEKHTVVTGTVTALPSILQLSQMPWKTEMELEIGDKVVMYYLAVMKAMMPEYRNFIKKDKDIFVFIKYSNIYAAIRSNQIIPVNGYILAEPCPDPFFERKKEESEKKGISIVKINEKSNKNGVFAIARYIGKPNIEYKEPSLSDKNIEVKQGDILLLKKVRDITPEYEYHAKLDGGKLFYRIQRHDIIATL